MIITKIKPDQRGLTLIELIIAIFIFSIISLATVSLVLLAFKTYKTAITKTELIQNSALAQEIFTSDLRQAKAIMTSLPSNNTNPQNPPSTEIIFQDGHNTNNITYTRYYLDSSNKLLKKSTWAYYFADNPTIYVTASSTNNGAAPLQISLGNNVVGENFSNLEFWNQYGAIAAHFILQKNNSQIEKLFRVLPKN